MRRKSPTNCGTITFPKVHSTLMALPGLAVKISPNSANGLTLESCYLSTDDPGVILPIWKSHRKGLDLPSRRAVKEYLKKISMLVAPRLTYPNPTKATEGDELQLCWGEAQYLELRWWVTGWPGWGAVAINCRQALQLGSINGQLGQAVLSPLPIQAIWFVSIKLPLRFFLLWSVMWQTPAIQGLTGVSLYCMKKEYFVIELVRKTDISVLQNIKLTRLTWLLCRMWISSWQKRNILRGTLGCPTIHIFLNWATLS